MKTTGKSFLVVFIGVLSLLIAGGTGYAAVGGLCSNCHTMHNSQGGVDLDALGPYGALTKGTCLGCHTTTGTDPLGDANNYPYVKLGGGATNWLAGGYFTDGGLNHDDNSHTLASTVTPAGFDGVGGTFTNYSGGTDGLSCAGTAGCHGVQTTANQATAISGGHHGNNTALGYRMLCVDTEKVDGTGASDYEEALNLAPDAADPHNLYNAGVATNATISELCGKCHGDFHGTANTKIGDDWVRHPTDNLITTTWEIQTITNYTATDWKFNPAGTVDMAAPATGNLYVTCLSCHRAHGTEYNDVLRFDYAAQSAGGGGTTGCLGCHTAQR
ncbi:MAG: cytochrome c3 family protein [Pseudomonadota bacterium]